MPIGAAAAPSPGEEITVSVGLTALYNNDFDIFLRAEAAKKKQKSGLRLCI